MSKTRGSIPYIKDLPYPVGRDTNTSFPDMNVKIASSFNSILSFSVMIFTADSAILNLIINNNDVMSHVSHVTTTQNHLSPAKASDESF